MGKFYGDKVHSGERTLESVPKMWRDSTTAYLKKTWPDEYEDFEQLLND